MVLSDQINGNQSVSCSISYIDKRPIVEFKSPYDDKGIEIGDVLFLFNRNLRHGQNARNFHQFGKAVFVQAKLREKDTLVFKRKELKQHYLYKEWPTFNLKKPTELGRISHNSTISFQPINNNNPNPGAFLKLSTERTPLFFLPENLETQINIAEFLNGIVSGRTMGRDFYKDDEFSLFTHETYMSSLSNTFIRKTYSPNRVSRVIGEDPYQNILSNRGFYHWFNFDSQKIISNWRIILNCLKLLLSSVRKSFNHNESDFDRRLWIVSLEVMNSEV